MWKDIVGVAIAPNIFVKDDFHASHSTLGGYSKNFYPFHEVIGHCKHILVVPSRLQEGAQDIGSQSFKWVHPLGYYLEFPWPLPWYLHSSTFITFGDTIIKIFPYPTPVKSLWCYLSSFSGPGVPQVWNCAHVAGPLHALLLGLTTAHGPL